jgi:hypothetical protein
MVLPVVVSVPITNPKAISGCVLLYEETMTLETYRCDLCNDGIECVLIAEFANDDTPKFCPYDGTKTSEWHLQRK